MSADNYTTCPQCELRRAAKLSGDDAALREMYGTADRATYEVARESLAAKLAAPLPRSMREDFEIGIEDGEFFVDYRASCSLCGFKFHFEQSVLPAVEVPS